MVKKNIVSDLLKIFLFIFIFVASMFARERVAFAQGKNVNPQVVLVDWVPMSASSKVKPPSGKDIYKALQKCLRKGSIGFGKNAAAFWTCMAKELGQGTWDANYKIIICATFWYYDKSRGVPPSICGACYINAGKSPCDPTCTVPKHEQDCCDLKFVKCMVEAYKAGGIAIPVKMAECDYRHTVCYGG